MEMIKLKNGAEEVAAIVATVTMTLRKLFDTQPIIAYELVMLARDATHTPWGATLGELKRAGLVGPDGRMHTSIRNVVLSAVTGDGGNMVLGNPRATVAAQ